MMYKVAYVTAGMGLRTLLPLIFRNGVSLRPLCVIRLSYILLVAVVLSILGIFSAMCRALFARRRPLRSDPIFIVGHYRTGSTYLHELLARDLSLAAPTTLLCTSPIAFPLSRVVLQPFMMIIGRGKRPMDNVLIDPRAPQEDEFALLRLTGLSPLIGLAYPRRDGRYFLPSDDTFMLSTDAQTARWKSALTSFIRLVEGRRGRRPVLKNPCHAFRIDVLREMFPNASFIHLRRNPLDVIPSTMRMWSIIGPRNVIRGTWRNPSMEEVIDAYNFLERRAREQLSRVPHHRKIEVSFEELEKDPTAVLQSIYHRFDMNVSPALEKRWERFISSAQSYQKNRYFLSPVEKELIHTRALF
jgi:hypothetical protein